MAKGAAITAGAAGLGALVVGLKASLDTSLEHAKALAQTNAVLKSTGGAAGVTAGDVTGLADKIEKMTGVDDLAVQKGENLLLTFTDIRNEVGKGNDIFTRATGIITDMSVALGQDMKSSAIQLGKALNDPIKGVTSLRRVGVQFTDAQKEQIKTLVESGDKMGAQKIILKELGKEFGGSAKAAGQTFGGQMNILKARIDDVAQKIGDKLLPYLLRFVKWVNTNWPQISRAFETAFGVIKDVFEKIKPLFDNFIKIVKGIVQVVQGIMKGDWSKVWDGIKNIVTGALGAIITQLENTVGEVAKLALKIGKTIFDQIVKGLGAILTLVDDYVIKPIISGLTGFATSVVNTAKSVGTAIVKGIVSGITGAASDVTNAVIDIGGKVGQLASRAWDAVKGVGTKFANVIADGVKGAAQTVENAVIELGGKIGNLAGRAWDAVVSLGKSLAGKVASGVTQGAEAVVNAAIEIGGKIGNLAGRAWDAVVSLGRTLAGKIAAGVTNGVGAIVDAVISIGGAIGNLAGRAWDAVVGLGRALGGKIVSGLRAIIDAIKIPSISLSIPYPTVSVGIETKSVLGIPIPYPTVDFGINWYKFTVPGFDPIPSFAEGGIVRQPTLALIGEAGPEAVVPLNRNGSGWDTYEFHFHGPVYTSEADLAQKIAGPVLRELQKKGAANGGRLKLSY